MSKSKDSSAVESVDRQFVLLMAKKDRIFSRMKSLYDLTAKISNFASRSNESFIAQSELIDEMRGQFENIVDKLNEHQLSLNSNFTVDYKSLDDFEDLYLCIKHARNKINAASQSNISQDKSFNVKPNILLPPIELPSFDGKTENWPKFYESFKSNIHNNEQLTDSQRVQYLVGKLTHSALKITAGIVPTGDTYNIIWNSLVNKYQDKRALGTHYLNNLLDAKQCNNSCISLESFIEKYSSSVAALRQLGIEDLTDFILFHCAFRKIDAQTAQTFELSVRSKEIPSYSELVTFVQDQVKILQRQSNSLNLARASNSGVSERKPSATQSPRPNTYKSFVARNNVPMTSSSTRDCYFCGKSGHSINICSEFKNLSTPYARFEFIKTKHGCVNCLSKSHTVTSCQSKHVCDICKSKHNTLLHFNDDHNIRSNNSSEVSQVRTDDRSLTSIAPQRCSRGVDSSAHFAQTCPADVAASDTLGSCTNKLHDVNPTMSNPSLSLSAEVKPNSTVLLSTAQVYAMCPNGDNNNKRIIRCLIDNGSQNNLISVDCCKALNLVIIPLSNSFVKGIGSSSRPILGYVNLDIESRIDPNNKYKIHALVIDCITDQLPTHYIAKGDVGYLKGLPLADLTWNVPGNIDVVLGAQLFPHIYLGNKVESGTAAPPALLTAFGYVLMGDYPNATHKSSSFSALALNDLLQRFWQLEELPNMQFLSPQDTECENLFTSSVTRTDEGRYSVALPFCKDPSELGNSRSAALRRFMALERKFKHSPELHENYNNVIKDYINSGYLSPVAESEVTDDGYYIPHHAVVRPDKPLPRIVLDASAVTHTGLSLNDVLHTGPNLQADLFLLLLGFRLHQVAMTADIKQMYLQIEVPNEHRKYLRILYRFHNNDPLQTFQFHRVPFGLKSSPYLAMRTVRQLAQDMKPHFPEAANVAESKLYMDDLVHSIADETSAIQLSRELIALFKSGAFDLIKWSSNSQILLDNLPDSHRSTIDFSNESNNVSKVLGLSWGPVDDCFFFTTHDLEQNCTKRNILSVVARLFDVLGLVAPVILYAKLLIKELWLDKVGWDEVPTESIRQRFAAFAQELPLISTIKIPRHVGVLPDCPVLIVAFCDASMNGYGAVIYLRTTHPSGNITVRLLCAKSKVSPTKVTTLARLELCAAVLMSKLIRTVQDTYRERLPIAGIYAFSDSTIALSWIHSSPHRWSVFVGNRVAQCQENLAPQHFYHVSGSENPSDCLSRGSLPSQLVSNDLWWNGPPWIRTQPSGWPVKPFTSDNTCQLPEHKANVLIGRVQCEPLVLNELASRVSSWDKLLRIIIYILRFVKKITSVSGAVNSLMTAEKVMIRSVQRAHFADDFNALKDNKLPSKKLQHLSVFIDDEDLLRIGGRLSNSDLPYEAKHPLLLPKHDPVVDLIIDHGHVMNCHTGSGLLMSILRQRYWILDARTVVRARVRKCNYCFRVNPSHPNPKMADLPACRVVEAKAFVHTGVDYAGPLRVTLARRRGQHSQKAYICLFVCLVTKAVHIELVSELTSTAFLAAFSRFISRRGPVSCLYSDNGTNFVGAKAQLDDLFKFLVDSEFQPVLKQELYSRRIEWKMIPPRSPHFGGIWESNIKSLKTHLYRVIGSQLLTYEELQTVLIQIECIMNSRPLVVLSSDPTPEVITPAHFLMSTPLQYLPAVDLSDVRINLVQRKQLLDSMVQSFWKKWRLEYLHTLQVRQKWTTNERPIQVGTVVIVGRDDCPPLAWPLGVITEIHPGSDKIIRVVTVKTKCGSFKRPVVKLYPLPTQ